MVKVVYIGEEENEFLGLKRGNVIWIDRLKKRWLPLRRQVWCQALHQELGSRGACRKPSGMV